MREPTLGQMKMIKWKRKKIGIARGNEQNRRGIKKKGDENLLLEIYKF